MRAPQTRMPRPGNARMQLIPFGLSWSCSALVMLSSRRDRAADDLVGRRLVDAAGVVVAGPDAGHVAGRRHELRLAGERVEDLDPRPVERRVLGVVAGLVDPPLLDLLGVEPWRRVEDGDAVAHELAVGDHRELDGLEALEVDDALLVDGHEVRHGQHRDLVDGLETGEAGAVGRVAHVVVGGHARGDGRAAAGERRRSRSTGTARAPPVSSIDDRLGLGLDDRGDVRSCPCRPRRCRTSRRPCRPA